MCMIFTLQLLKPKIPQIFAKYLKENTPKITEYFLNNFKVSYSGLESQTDRWPDAHGARRADRCSLLGDDEKRGGQMERCRWMETVSQGGYWRIWPWAWINTASWQLYLWALLTWRGTNPRTHAHMLSHTQNTHTHTHTWNRVNFQEYVSWETGICVNM